MEGHAVDRVGVILQGRVEVCHLTDDGQEIMFTLREPGDLLGHMEAVTAGTAIATVITLEPLEGLFLSAVTSEHSSRSIPGWRCCYWRG